MKKGERGTKTVRNIFRIAKFIEINPETYLSEIAKNLKLHPYTVQRCLREINGFLVAKSTNEQLGRPLPNLPVFLRIKEGFTADGIVRYLKIRDKMKI